MVSPSDLKILKAADSPLLILDAAEKLVYANRLFCTAISVPFDEIRGKSFSELLSNRMTWKQPDEPVSETSPGSEFIFQVSADEITTLYLSEVFRSEERPDYTFLLFSDILPHRIKEDNSSVLSLLYTIQDDVFGLSGEELFVKLAAKISEVLECAYTFISKVNPGGNSVTVIGGYSQGNELRNFTYDLEYTPCEKVTNSNVCIINSGVQSLYPKDQLLSDMGAESYIGVPLFKSKKTPIGIINVLHTAPFKDAAKATELLNVFSGRIAAELDRYLTWVELQKNKNRYFTLFEKIEDAVFIVEKNTQRILDANQAALRITGYELDLLKNMTHSEICRFSGEVSEIEADGHDVVYTNIDGTERNTYNRIIPFDAATDYIIATDITQIRRVSRKLKESEFRYTSVLNEIPNMVIIHRQNEIIFANRFLYNKTGYSETEIIGNNIRSFVSPEHHYLFTDDRAKNENRETSRTYNIEFNTKDQKKLTLLVNSHPIVLNGQMASVSILTDITEIEDIRFFQGVLLELSKIALYSESSEEFYHSMYNLIAKILIVPNFFLALIYEVTAEIEFVYWADEFDTNPGRVPMGRGLTEYVYRTNKPLNADKQTTLLLEEQGEIEVIGSDSTEWIGVPLNNEKGVPFGVLVAQNYTSVPLLGERQLKLLEFVSQQISLTIQRKNAEEALRKNEDRFRKIFSNATIGIYRSTPEGKLLLANKALAEMLGYASEDELLSGSVTTSSFFDSFSRQKFLNEIIETGSITGKEYKWSKRSGEELFVRESAQLVRDEEGNVLYFEGLVENISDKKNAENKLREQQEQYFAFFHNSEQAGIIFKMTGASPDHLTVEMINASALSMLGFDHATKTDFAINDVFDESTLEKIAEAITFVNIHNRTYSFEYASPLNSGIYLANFFRVSKSLFAFTAIDITEEKTAQSKLIEARNKAEEINRIKSAFFASMSHELRTPLMGILGNAEIISESIEDTSLRELAETIRKSGNRLYDSVTSILDISNLDSDKITPELKPERIAPLLENIWNTYKERAEKKNLQFELMLQNTDITATIDAKLFSEIVNHLVNNAIKFTFSGGLSLTLHESADEFSIIVKDTGIGIEPDKLNLIFEEFRQESEGLSRSFEGTGLGLSIAKRYTELLGGAITVKSKKNFGSEFTITFPIHKQESTPQSPVYEDTQNRFPENPFSKRKNILLVENDELNISVITAFVKNRFNLLLATNGTEALELLKSYKVDAILLDINLGAGISGIEVIQEARKNGFLPEVPIIASTAFAMAGDREEFIKAGCTHYISKPFTKSELLTLLNDIFL